MWKLGPYAGCFRGLTHFVVGCAERFGVGSGGAHGCQKLAGLLPPAPAFAFAVAGDGFGWGWLGLVVVGFGLGFVGAVGFLWVALGSLLLRCVLLLSNCGFVLLLLRSLPHRSWRLAGAAKQGGVLLRIRPALSLHVRLRWLEPLSWADLMHAALGFLRARVPRASPPPDLYGCPRHPLMRVG